MEIEDVVICYFKVNYPGHTPNKSDIKKIIRKTKEFLKEGWTVQQITDRIVKYKDEKRNVFDLLHSEKPPFNIKGNLLEDKFYYHHRLHSVPGPNEIEIDVDGTIYKKSHPFYLEIIDYFSLEDLVNYFHTKMKIDDKVKFRENKHTLKYLHNNYGLDLLLFSIDEAYNYLKDKNYRLYSNARRILNHTEDAQEIINKIKDTGTTKVKPYYRAYLKQRGDNIG